MSNEEKLVGIVVCTSHSGVFFGYGTPPKIGNEIVPIKEGEKMLATAVLKDARMVVYWAEETAGVLGLAKTGPIGQSRVTPAASELYLTDVTAWAVCTEESCEVWAAGLWDGTPEIERVKEKNAFKKALSIARKALSSG